LQGKRAPVEHRFKTPPLPVCLALRCKRSEGLQPLNVGGHSAFRSINHTLFFSEAFYAQGAEVVDAHASVSVRSSHEGIGKRVALAAFDGQIDWQQLGREALHLILTIVS
jgi:urease beta subunit